MGQHRAAVLSHPGVLTVAMHPSRALAPHEVRLRVRMAGVCGTDLALLRGTLPSPLPLTPGHEFTGEVIEVASDRDAPWLGRRVCADINNTCLSRREASPCRACHRGHPHHCQRRTVTGIIAAPGAFAGELIVPAENLFAVPDSVTDERAVFAEPLAAAVEAFEQVPIGPGDVVAVLGLGRLGALVAAVAQRRGARVLGVGRREERLRRVRTLGIETAVAQGRAVRETIDAWTDGLGADVAVEATGTPDGLPQALTLVRPRGTVILKTTCGLPAAGLDATRIAVDEISLVGSRCGPIGQALDLLATGDLPVERLIEEVFTLGDISRALARAEEAFKVLVRLDL